MLFLKLQGRAFLVEIGTLIPHCLSMLEDKLDLVVIKYENDSVCMSLTFLDQPLS